MITVEEDKWEKIRERMCDDFCYWPIHASSQGSLDLHCEKCPLNEVDSPMGYCPHQEQKGDKGKHGKYNF